jgi:small subunit ribosomal protein S16
MLTIRLTRIGKKKQPFYRFIVSEKSKDPWGKALEILGIYNPLTSPATLVLKQDRIAHWISKGAQCSDSVWNLLIDQKLVTGAKRHINSISKRRKEKLAKEAAQPAA